MRVNCTLSLIKCQLLVNDKRVLVSRHEYKKFINQKISSFYFSIILISIQHILRPSGKYAFEKEKLVRIGIFTNCYHPLVNGVVGVISLLRRGCLEKGHQVYIFAPAVDDYIDEEEGIFRYRSIDLTQEVKYPVAIPFSPRINRIINNLNLDILHSHHPFVLGPVAIKTAARKRIPVIYTFHTQYEQYNHYIPLPGQLVNWITRRKIKSFCQKVNGVTTPAESARQILLGYGITQPITVIPNPTLIAKPASNESRLEIRSQYGLNQEKLLVNIGRIAPEKNLGLLLQAFRHLLNQSLPDPVKLMIVGDGPDLENLKNQAKTLGISADVVFTGLVSPDKVPQFLAASDLFVMTSKSEVKPLAQLEALAAGVPIVAVAAAGANDTIIHEQNGLLVSENAEAISDAITKLIFDDQKMAAFREEALETAMKYSYPKITDEYLTLYNQLISNFPNNSKVY